MRRPLQAAEILAALFRRRIRRGEWSRGYELRQQRKSTQLVDRQEEVHLLLSAVLEHKNKHRMGSTPPC